MVDDDDVAESVVVMGNESEKKDRWPPENSDMTWRTLGELVEGHVERQMLVQRVSSLEREWSWAEAQPVEARVGPSSRVRMWVWIMSGWRVEIEAAGFEEKGVSMFVEIPTSSDFGHFRARVLRGSVSLYRDLSLMGQG